LSDKEGRLRGRVVLLALDDGGGGADRAKNTGCPRGQLAEHEKLAYVDRA
jgi:hypothetical protein